MLIQGISKSFAGQVEATLKNITLELAPGEFCIVIGSNGSGKSTLLKSIAGEYTLDAGKITIADQNITVSSAAKRAKLISSVTQDLNNGTVSAMTLLENIVLSLMRGKNADLTFYKTKKQQVLDIVQKLGIGLEQYLDCPLQNLSGGQQQMVATLMAICSKPQVLLLDEHTSALDPKMQKELMQYTANAVLEEQITTLMVTHKLNDAICYGNRIIMMHKGSIVLDLKGKQKQKLKLEDLLKLFHQYEDKVLLADNLEGGEQ